MNKNDIKLRKIEKNDLPLVIELLQSISEYRPALNEYDNIWKEFSMQNNVHSLVAFINDKLVGYGSLVIEIKIRSGRLGHIEDIVSDTKYRNKGVGLAIVNGLKEIAAEKGCYKLALECKENNIGFYNKCGFLISGTSMNKLL